MKLLCFSLLPLLSSLPCLYCRRWAPSYAYTATVELLVLSLLPLSSTCACLYCRYWAPAQVQCWAPVSVLNANAELQHLCLLPLLISFSCLYCRWWSSPITTTFCPAPVKLLFLYLPPLYLWSFFPDSSLLYRNNDPDTSVLGIYHTPETTHFWLPFLWWSPISNSFTVLYCVQPCWSLTHDLAAIADLHVLTILQLLISYSWLYCQ
jgi:hypothetical protein